MAESYEKAGVNLEAGYEVVRRIKKHVASTSRLGVMGNIGAFGGMFDLSALNVKEPVLVSGTDGVGTKLKLAFEMDKHDTIGIDAVAMCVNDDVIRRCDVHGISHITGGGFDENIPRILHEGQGIEIEEGTWEILPVFRFLEKYGKVAHREMFNIFNMGVGMVIALDAEEAQKAVDILASHGEQASVIGRVTDSEGVVIR